ncbi:MAG: hypothetical protein VZS44_03815 [Bacilli bacterium]|nr:hypothetical protein [Bacilli bacterium]
MSINSNKKEFLMKYDKVKKLFGMNDDELVLFLFNFYDSVAFNRYYPKDFLNFDFNSDEELAKYVDFFNSNNIDVKTAKELFISIPSMLSCDNPMEDIDIIYKDDNVEGLVIYDRDNYCHPYRKTNNMRSIMENHSFVNDLKKNSLMNKKYTKSFYLKNDKREFRIK